MTFHAKLEYTAEDFLNYARIHRRTHQKVMLVLRPLIFVLFVGDAAFLMMLAFRYERVDFFDLFLAVLTLALAVFYFLIDRIRARATLKLRRKTYGEMDLSFDEEGAAAQSVNFQSQYLYPAFTELFYSRTFETYYLYINKHQAIVLPERCFTQGDPAAFGPFLTEKTGLEMKEIK